MKFDQIIQELMADSGWAKSLGLFSPELTLCLGIVALLLLRLVGADRWLKSYWLALAVALTAFGFAFVQFEGFKDIIRNSPSAASGALPFFTGLLTYDMFSVYFRLFLLLFLILVIALTVLGGIPDDEDAPDFYTLLMGATIGMMLMASANHLLILFLGIEMTSVPSYAMVGFLKGRRQSSEAALKYVVYGAGAAGVMLYGISLLAGLTGTAELPALAARLGAMLTGTGGMADPAARTVVLAAMMVLVGLAFKLSIFPFHFWCPDAFEGAAAEVAGFLSVASKGAAFALLVRFCLAIAGNSSPELSQITLALGIGLGVVAAVTATFGNLAAYAQTNIKRLLAYSTIAHAGYMLMAVAAMMVLLQGGASDRDNVVRSVEGLLYYLAVYLFMNLGAFAVVALIRNQIFSEEIEDYAGIGAQAPILGVCMLVCLFSLIGLPPFGGFVGKFMVFASLFEAGRVHWSMWVVLSVGAINTVFSLVYYIRVLKVMFLSPRPATARRVEMPLMPAGAYVLLVVLPVIGLGASPLIGRLSLTANHVASMLIPAIAGG